MSNFRPINRDTGFLLPPSVDEWLPQRHLARFVVEVLDGLDLSELVKAYRGSGSAKALRQSGVDKALILAELGINGWKRQGLPTVVVGKGSETQALAMLDECAHDKSKCPVKTP